MSAEDPFVASTTPITFHHFLERMREPSAADLVKGIKGFITNFMATTPDEARDTQAVQNFLSQTEAAFRSHPLWKDAKEDDIEGSGEGLEKYLMTKLYPRTFAVLVEDTRKDALLTGRMRALEFLRPEHLDIPQHYVNEAAWLLPQKELQKINQYKAPRDKLVCILNCCRVINNLLNVAASSAPPGADEFLPVLIYIVIKASPPQLNSNLQFIQRFRLGNRLSSESAYFYTNVVSAASFIENLQPDMLTGIPPEEITQRMQEAGVPLNSGDAPGSAALYNLADEPSESTSSVIHATGEGRADATNGGGSSRRASAASDGISPSPSMLELASPAPAAAPIAAPPPPPAPPAPPTAPVPTELGSASQTVRGVEEMGAQAMAAEATTASLMTQRYRFLYADAGDLTVRSVGELLAEHQELILRYEALARGLTVVLGGGGGGGGGGAEGPSAGPENATATPASNNVGDLVDLNSPKAAPAPAPLLDLSQ